MASFNLNDPKNILGMGAILNDETLKMDLTDVEQSITEGTSYNKPRNNFSNNMNNVLEDFETSLDPYLRTDSRLTSASALKVDDAFDMNNIYSNGNDIKVPTPHNMRPPSRMSTRTPFNPESRYIDSSTPHPSRHIQTPAFADHSPSPVQQSFTQPTRLTSQYQNTPYQGSNTPYQGGNMTNQGSSTPYPDIYTNADSRPQVYQPIPSGSYSEYDNLIASYSNNTSENTYNAKKTEDNNYLTSETEEDEMIELIEQCDALRQSLRSEGVDVDKIKVPNHDMSKKEVITIFKTLRAKNDKMRYCDIFEEVIISCSYMLEGCFDGKTNILGTEIDLIGFTDTVKIKLRRMRFDTSAFVGDIMRNYNLGNGFRIALELIPSIFLYSRDRRRHATDSLVADATFRETVSRMNKNNTV